MQIIPRSEWGGEIRPRKLVKVTHPYVEVHHSGVLRHYSTDPLTVALEIERDHLGRGWAGTFYGLEIPADGRLIEGRGIGYRSIGKHRKYYDDGTPVDRDALTVLLHGDYRTDQVTPAQLATLDALRSLVPDRRLRWHRMRDNTACPGTNAIEACRKLNARPDTPDDGDDDMARPMMVWSAGYDGDLTTWVTDMVVKRPVLSTAHGDLIVFFGYASVATQPDGSWLPHNLTRAQLDAIPVA